jgi:hypothetical protein
MSTDLNLDELLTEVEEDQVPPTQIVVRLRRSYWHDLDGVYQRISIKYLKRHTQGFNLLEDDCKMIGADDAVARIINLDRCEDGIYELVMCNAHTDWETGHVEDWEYRLEPFTLPQK